LNKLSYLRTILLNKETGVLGVTAGDPPSALWVSDDVGSLDERLRIKQAAASTLATEFTF
jgi:hypothetical protein